MAKSKEKNKAIKLRKNGKSINEIAAGLKIPKSTISFWCRNIKLTNRQIRRLVLKQKTGSYKGRIIAAEKLRKRRLKEVELLRREGLEEIGKISKRDLFIGGVALYWAEGYTYVGDGQVGFTNSDPKIIIFILRWFKEICQVADDDFCLQIRINQTHKKRIKEIEKYWSLLAKIPLSQFNKTILIKTKLKKFYPNHNTYYGTLRIRVRRGTKLRRKISGWIEGLGKI